MRESDLLYKLLDPHPHDESKAHGVKLDTNVEITSTTLAFGQYLDSTGFKLRTVTELINYILFGGGQGIRVFKDLGKDVYGLFMDLSGNQMGHLPPQRLMLTARDVRRWNMAWQAIQLYELVEGTGEDGVKRFARLGVQSLPGLLTERCKDWPDLDDIYQWPIAFGFSVTAFVYGGLHALAWFAHFNSNIEQLLWRVSACVVMGGFPVGTMLNYLWGKIDYEVDLRYGRGSWHQYAIYCVFVVSRWLTKLLTWLIVLAYPLARAYLVVECFINLSHLPAGAYDVPNWSAYFPHIS